MPIDRPSGGQDAPGDSPADQPELPRPPEAAPEKRSRWLDLDALSDEALMSAQGYDTSVRQSTPDTMPVTEDDEPAVADPLYRSWYRERGGEHPRAPAPFEIQHAVEVPEYQDGQGAQGRLVDAGSDFVWDGQSGYEGPAKEVGWQRLGLPSAGRWLASHVESHAAALMRERGMEERTLYINRAVCPYDYPDDHPARTFPFTCDNYLERMLPPDAKLTVYGPDGFEKVYRGRTGEGEAQG